MSEFLLRSSSKNRQKSGVSLSHDFTTRFNNPLKLSYDMKHELAVRTIHMTYSWYNIRQSYGNNKHNLAQLGTKSFSLMGCTAMMTLMNTLKRL